MGVEIGAADITQKDGIEGSQTFERTDVNGELNKESGVNGTAEPIKFGSHGTGVPAKGVDETVANSLFPKNAADEWPEPKHVHQFYFVRVRPFEDPKLKIKIEQAEKDLQKKNQAFFQLTDAIKSKRSERAQVIMQLKPLTSENKRYRSVIEDRRKELEPLNQALGKLRSSTGSNRERGVVICSSEEELNVYIQSLNYRIQHESNTLVEEKQMLREIKQLEATRERVIANAAEKAKIQDSMGQKEDIQDQVKLIGLDLDGVRKDQQTNRAKIKHLEDELKIIDEEIKSLQEEVDVLKEKKEKAYEVLAELRKQRDDGNAYYYQNRSLLNNAKDLAAKKDVRAVTELCHAEVEKFMSVWSSTKSFRADYEKRMLGSLDQRQMSRDGRLRNPNEKLLVEPPPVAPAEAETVAKPNIKRLKEDPRLATQHEVIPPRKVQKEDGKKLPEPETINKIDEDKETLYTVEKAQEAPAIDPAQLKEMKREEEIAKAKLALERKKKMAEKAAAKATARAQKEAEKKLKEREKKAKKKAGGPAASAVSSEEQTEPEEEVVEPEKPDVNMDATQVSKPKDRKENTLRYYRKRGKGADTLPKAILKRRKSTPYWVWAVPAAVLVVFLLVLGYYYYYLL